MIVTAKDLRFNISMLFDALSNGEEITITYRGKAKAKLISAANTKTTQKEDVAFGMWKDKNGDVDTLVRTLRKGRTFDI